MWAGEKVEGSGTRTVVSENGNKATIYPGSKVMFTTDLTLGKVAPCLDAPQSLLMIGEGGLTWNGNNLKEGLIYRFDDNSQPHATAKGDYGVWIAFNQDATIYEQKAHKGRPLATVRAEEQAVSIDMLGPFKLRL